MLEKNLKNPHAGEILKQEFLDELGMNENTLACAINLPVALINEIIKGNHRITAETDLRLCRFLGLSEGYFLRLQNSYELMEARLNLGDQLSKIIPFVGNSTIKLGKIHE